MKQIGPWSAFGVWAVLCLGGFLYGSWQGYGGRAFAATITVMALLLLVTLLLAARGVADQLSARFGAASGVILGALIFLFDVVYLVCTGTFDIRRAGAIAALISTAPGPGGEPTNMPIEVRQIMTAAGAAAKEDEI